MNVSCLSLFFRSIKHDNRITTAHISLFMALYERWSEKGFNGPVSVKRQELMDAAKISGLATYHRCIKDLAQFGYIHYVPSYNPAISSQVHILVGYKGGCSDTLPESCGGNPSA